MRIIITGGAGFIGSNIVDALVNDKNDVVIFDNFYSGRKKNLHNAEAIAAKNKTQFEIIEGDISLSSDWKKLSPADAIFHIAAQTSVTASVKERDKDFAWNINASKNLIEFLLEKKVKYLLYSNTAGALYGVPTEFPTPETHSVYPTSPYGATKSFLETYIRALSTSLKSEGTWSDSINDKNYFSWSSLRLGNVYGPRQITKGEAGVVPIFIEKFLSNTAPFIFGTGNETRDYVHVDDVVSAFMTVFKLMQKKAVDDAYNVGSGIETKTVEVFNHVKEALGSRSNAIAKANFAPMRPGELEKSCLNIDKLKKLGWAPRWTFKEGVITTVDSYLKFEEKT